MCSCAAQSRGGVCVRVQHRVGAGMCSCAAQSRGGVCVRVQHRVWLCSGGICDLCRVFFNPDGLNNFLSTSS